MNHFTNYSQNQVKKSCVFLHNKFIKLKKMPKFNMRISQT
jgi:hypothetical protein